MNPILCNYYVTLRCNSKCTFCDIWKKEENKRLREQTIEEVEDNLKDLKRLGVKVIDFTGGEPLLYPYIIEALEMAKRMGFYTTVTTNCLLYPQFAKRLKGKVDILQFSLDSVDEENHNETRGVKSFKKVMVSIELAKKIKQNVVIIHTVTNDNLKETQKLAAFSQEKKVLLVLNPCFDYFGNGGASAKTAASLKKYFPVPYVWVDMAHLELIERGGNELKNPICRAVSSTIVISPDNCLLLPCYHHATRKIKIRNNLYELYNSKEVQKMKNTEGIFPFCKGCTIYCYMRSSFYRNPFSPYPYLFMASGAKYLLERSRRQFKDR